MDTLGADLVLLSVNPSSGRLMTSQKLSYGLMGAELVGLVAAGRVEISAGRLAVRASAPTDDPELDAALASIGAARRPPRAKQWVGHPRRGIATAYLERLAAAGVLAKERGLLTRWRITDPARQTEARERIDAIAMSAGPVDLAQTALAGLAHAIGLDAALYPGWGNRPIRKRFKEIAEGAGSAAYDPAVQRAISATDAAVRAATEAAVHAAVQAAVDASISAAHSASAGGHGGHGGH